MAETACPDDKLADAVADIERAGRILRRETFVVMHMSTQDYVGAVIVQRLPERLCETVASTYAETRLMPVGEHVAALMRGQVCPQPLFLWRTSLAPADAGLSTFGVEHDDVPGTEIVAVVALTCRRAPRWVARRDIAEVPVITGRAGRRVVVVAVRRFHPSLVPSPCRVEAVREFTGRAVRIGVVAERKHRAGDAI